MVDTYPLIELGMTRQDCLRWLARQGYPRPPKSACIGCPFRDDNHWRAMKERDPDAWADAVEADRLLRVGEPRGFRAVEYMQRQHVRTTRSTCPRPAAALTCSV